MTYRILIIDDDHQFKRLLELRLKSFLPNMSVLHFDTLTAARGHLATPENRAFDLVLLDEHLPDGRGAEILGEGWFKDLAVISMSSDPDPNIPGSAVQAGAAYFLSKTQASEPLFRPLVLGVIDRNRIQRELNQAALKAAVMDTVKTLVGTLRHEINNPLGAVLGAAFLLKSAPEASPDQHYAAELVESSGKRIKHVLEQLCDAVSVQAVDKAHQKVFHIPGDKPWESSPQAATPISTKKDTDQKS